MKKVEIKKVKKLTKELKKEVELEIEPVVPTINQDIVELESLLDVELESLLDEMNRLGVNRKSEVEAKIAQLRLQ